MVGNLWMRAARCVAGNQRPECILPGTAATAADAVVGNQRRVPTPAMLASSQFVLLLSPYLLARLIGWIGPPNRQELVESREDSSGQEAAMDSGLYTAISRCIC